MCVWIIWLLCKRLLISFDLFHLRWNSGTNILKSSPCNANVYSQGEYHRWTDTNFYAIFLFYITPWRSNSCLLFTSTCKHSFGRDVFLIKKTQHSLCSKCTDGFITEFWELAVTQHHFVDWLEIFLSGLLNVLLKVIISHSCAIRKTLSCTWAMIYPFSWTSRFIWKRHYSRAKSSNPSFGKSPELYLAFKLWS